MGELIRKALLSGMLVGIGVVINTLAPDKVIGAILFSCALLTIIHLQLPLYTGKIGFVGATPIKELAMILACNFAGAAVSVGLVAAVRADFCELLVSVAAVKFEKGFLSMFVLGIMCGILMFVAVYTKKTLIVIFCIMIFILSGFEHCIADFPYLLCVFSLENAGKLLCAAAGNTVGSIGIYYLSRDSKKDEKI